MRRHAAAAAAAGGRGGRREHGLGLREDPESDAAVAAAAPRDCASLRGPEVPARGAHAGVCVHAHACSLALSLRAFVRAARESKLLPAAARAHHAAVGRSRAPFAAAARRCRARARGRARLSACAAVAGEPGGVDASNSRAVHPPASCVDRPRRDSDVRRAFGATACSASAMREAGVCVHAGARGGTCACVRPAPLPSRDPPRAAPATRPSSPLGRRSPPAC